MEQAEKDLVDEIKSLWDQLSALRAERQKHMIKRAESLLPRFKEVALRHFGDALLEITVDHSVSDWDVYFQIDSDVAYSYDKTRIMENSLFADPEIDELTKDEIFVSFRVKKKNSKE